jgi:hypothetical protein
VDLDQGKKMNEIKFGYLEDPKMVLINTTLPSPFVKGVESFIKSYKYVFASSYKELKGIPR